MTFTLNPNSPTKQADFRIQSPNDQSDITQVIQPNGGVVLGGRDYRGVPYGTYAQGGSGGIGGSGAAPQLAVFSNATTIASSSVSDDGANPTITPNGLNTALNGIYDQRVVDTGGVVANSLVCRSSNNKAVICPAGTTQGVLGVALSTVSVGGTVSICWAAHCSVIATNNTTAGHWLVPSASIAGQVDDTGTTTPPSGTQTFLAEATVPGGSVVSTTILSPDLIGNNGGGTGFISGSGTANVVAKFITSTSEGNSSITDDGTNPTRMPNGSNTALSGLYEEWVVDAGGVVANKLACRSGVNLVVICPVGATTTVLGVAQNTVAQGGTALIGWAGKLSVTSTNTTTAGHWLIPSVTVSGSVDDTGSTSQPTTGTQTFLAETSVSGGSLVGFTLLTPDTLNASGANAGRTTVTINSSATQNIVNLNSTTPAPGTGFLATTYAFSNSGNTSNVISKFAITGNTSTVASAGTISGTGITCGDGSGNITTVGCTAGGITSINASATGPAVTIVGLGSTGVSTSGNTISISGGTTGGIPSTWYPIGANYTILDTDNTNRLRLTTGALAITLPQPGTIVTSPLVALKFNSGVSGGQTSFTSGAYSQTGGNQGYLVVIQGENFGSSPTVTTTAGDSYILVGSSSDTSVRNDVYYCSNLTSSGSLTMTVTLGGTVAQATGIILYELTGTTHDNTLSASKNGSVVLSLSNPVHFQNAMAMAGGRTNVVSPAPPFLEIDTLFNGNVGTLAYKLLANANVSPVQMSGNNTALFQSILSISSHPAFTAGWYVVVENVASSPSIITSTSSTINGQATLVIQPQQSCSLLSNGANWDAICGFVPNIQQNGIVGGSVTIYAADQAAGTSSIGATTMLGTVSAPISRYMMTGYADVTVAGTSCAGNTTVVLNAIFTDPNTSSATTLALGTFTITTNGVVGTSNFSYPPVYFKAKGSTNIQFSTTYTAGGSCSPAPTVQVTPILQVI